MSELVRSAIDPARALADVAGAGDGSLVTFGGAVRNRNAGRDVEAIEYHAYDAMAVQEMDRIEAEVTARWPSAKVRIVHRIGLLRVGELSVLVVVASPHRAEGFEAARFAIDRVKQSVPIWKKEIYPDGYAWIEGS